MAPTTDQTKSDYLLMADSVGSLKKIQSNDIKFIDLKETNRQIKDHYTLMVDSTGSLTKWSSDNIWNTQGNSSNVDQTLGFVDTTSTANLVIKTAGQERMSIKNDGKITIDSLPEADNSKIYKNVVIDPTTKELAMKEGNNGNNNSGSTNFGDIKRIPFGPFKDIIIKGGNKFYDYKDLKFPVKKFSTGMLTYYIVAKNPSFADKRASVNWTTSIVKIVYDIDGKGNARWYSNLDVSKRALRMGGTDLPELVNKDRVSSLLYFPDAYAPARVYFSTYEDNDQTYAYPIIINTQAFEDIHVYLITGWIDELAFPIPSDK